MSATLTLTAAQADTIESRVDAISGALQALQTLLARERDGLRGRAAPEVLEQVAEDKDAAVEQVAVLYGGLREALAGIDAAGDSLPQHVAALRESHPSLAERVDRLVELTRDCQQANQDNGVLVSVGLSHARRALDTLHGAVPGNAPAPAMYGRGGRPAGGVAGDRLTVRA